MQENLKPYPQYKESGSPWFGNYPANWELLKTKYLFNERVEKGFPNESLLAATQTKGVVPKAQYENRTVLAQKDLHLLKLVEPGDFVISLRSFQGGIEKAYFRGIISPAYTVMIPSTRINAGYFKHLAKSIPFIKLLTTCVTGIREGQNIDYEILRRNKLPVPPLTEQHQIASYLDWKTSQITKFIKAKKRLIELLKEQKQVIINDAVTGKINVRTGKPYRKYKNSGVEWLGMVPEEWEVFPLKKIASSNLKTLGEKTNSDYEFDYLEINKVKAGYLIDTPTRLVFKDAPSRARRIVNYGDTIISTVRTYLRSVYYISNPYVKDLVVSTGFCVLTPKSNIVPSCLGYLLRSDYIIDRVIQNSIGVSYPAISDSKLMSLKVSLPPINEQSQIIKSIEIKTEKIDLSISTIDTEIKLLQEYRIRLIADVVTGKVDVRDVVVPVNAIDTMDEEADENDIEKIEEPSVNE